MGPALLLVARLYRVEQQARPITPEERLQLSQRQSRPILDKLRDYLREIQAEVRPKSPAGRAVSYTLTNWTALNRYCDDGDLEIDNNATERSIHGIAVGRRYVQLRIMRNSLLAEPRHNEDSRPFGRL